MAEEARRQETDLVLPIGVHAFVLDTTKGNVNVHVGPTKQPLSPQQDAPVVLNEKGRFVVVALAEAIKNNIVAAKGEYVILRNPAKENKFPKPGGSSTVDSETLRVGETVNLPGPVSFPLWPMQQAAVVKGHHLKSNQYLVVRVYDEEAAKANWGKGTVKLVDKVDGPDAMILGIEPDKLVIGQQIIIKGTEVSFYIPPTGVEVLAEDMNHSNRTPTDGAAYVRDALTLERLEYCLLVDEDGNKRYVRGPEVVFPEPTETFKLNDDQGRKSKAYELNEISGLHVKVIADYTDSFGVEHNEGDELFITGRHTVEKGSEEETSLYFPRIEHAILKYDGRTRYHAIAIPPGEARYVMDRLTGIVRLHRGPAMFLPDPRREVIVKRVLSQGEVDTYYPGNELVKNYNNELRARDLEAETLTNLPSTRTGHLSTAMLASMGEPVYASRAADVIERGSRYTPPRTLILNTRFEGAVNIRPFTGFAIQVVNQAGGRRVEVGPKTVQLEFDERLDVLALSTSTPKSEDKTLKTVYLRISNNSVSDIFSVKTADLVPVEVKLKYLVRFEDDQKDSWFAISNYVQHMCDRFRSLVNNFARTVEVQEFYAKAGSLLRDLILGTRAGDAKDRPGYLFDENGMRVFELDVLNVRVLDQTIGSSMQLLQTQRINNYLQSAKERSDLELVISQEKNKRERTLAEQETTAVRHEALMKDVALSYERNEAEAKNTTAVNMLEAEGEREQEKVKVEVAELTAQASRIRTKQHDEAETAALVRRIFELTEEAAADKARIGAISPQLTAALMALAQAGALPTIAKHFGDLSIIRQQSIGGTFEAMFKGTPLEGFLENLGKLGSGQVVGHEK